MLSDSLRALAAHFDQWALRPTPVALDEAACSCIARELRSHSEQARALEGSPVPPAARAVAGGNLVMFEPFRAARRGGAAA